VSSLRISRPRFSKFTTTATTCILLLVGRFLIVQGHASLGQEADRLIETYGPVARRAQTGNPQNP
jgi:hypothetical protein